MVALADPFAQLFPEVLGHLSDQASRAREKSRPPRSPAEGLGKGRLVLFPDAREELPGRGTWGRGLGINFLRNGEILRVRGQMCRPNAALNPGALRGPRSLAVPHLPWRQYF